jgi:hypothetical protein
MQSEKSVQNSKPQDLIETESTRIRPIEERTWRSPDRLHVLPGGGGGMYDDDDFWPLKCPSCSHGFTDSIRRIKSRFVSSCPKCSSDFAHEAEQFAFALSEARKGRRNPWWEILRVQPAG